MGPYIRIGLRYAAGALVAHGLLNEDVARELSTDPDVVSIVTMGVDWAFVAGGAAIAGAVEWVYAEAKKRGWST